MTIQTNRVATLREMTDRSWMEQASCRGVDTDRWFYIKPPKHVRRHIREVCSSCPVTRACLSYALVNHEEHGAWGGYMMGDLQTLQRQFASGESLSRVLNGGLPQDDLRQGSDAA